MQGTTLRYLLRLLSVALIGFGSAANAQENALSAVERTAAITEVGAVQS